MAFELKFLVRALTKVGAALLGVSHACGGPGDKLLAADVELARLNQFSELHAESMVAIGRLLLRRFAFGFYITMRGKDMQILVARRQWCKQRVWPFSGKLP